MKLFTNRADTKAFADDMLSSQYQSSMHLLFFAASENTGGVTHAFQLSAIIITAAAILSFINHRFLRLPTTIGLMIATLLLSVAFVLAANAIWPALIPAARAFVEELHFSEALMHVLLGFLLFAGALHVDLEDLRAFRFTIALLVIVGVVVSTLVVGLLTWVVLQALGLGLPLIACFLFGALISPTDPIAVMGLLKRVGAPKSLEVKIAGESLFNDGVGVVVFLGLLRLATAEKAAGPFDFALLFLQEAVGGVVLGAAAGLLVFWMLSKVDNYHVEILLSLALVVGGYALATAIHVSGPIAMVIAGLLIGNHGRSLAMSPRTVRNLDLFWELVDEILNAVLFVLIGLEVLILTWSGQYLFAGLGAIVITLIARLFGVAIPIAAMRSRRGYTRYTVAILTWGGLRGGISVALALSLPPTLAGVPEFGRELIIAMTYMVVVFSIVVQGLTMRSVLAYGLSQQDAAIVNPPPKPGH